MGWESHFSQLEQLALDIERRGHSSESSEVLTSSAYPHKVYTEAVVQRCSVKIVFLEISQFHR